MIIYILEKILPLSLHIICLDPVNHLVENLGKLYLELQQHLVILHFLREDYHGMIFSGECYKCDKYCCVY